MSNRTSEDEIRSLVVKARVADSGIAAPTAVQDDMTKMLQAVFGKARVLEPPYDPRLLMRIAENSSALNQNVESYMTNIDGLGYRLEPVFDFDSSDTFEKVREAMWLGMGDKKASMPDDAAVEEQIISLKRQSHLEELELKNFFQFMNPDGSFTTLRRETRQHLEITGNAYWEILRDNKGKIARAVIVPSTHVRLMTVDSNPIEVSDKVKVGPLQESTVVQYRFFRRFVQAIGQRAVYFKEFGDPRVISRDTGKIYADIKTFLSDAGDGDAPANEIMHFKLPRPGEAYGIPRWIGSLLSVLGSRATDEVNYDYFDNKAIPPMALLVQGGRIGGDDVSVIENYIRDHVRGRQNFHKMLIIEAVASDAQQLAGVTTQPTLKFERLTDTQLAEGQFQKYDERNIDKIGSAFRLPRIMRGDIRDFNKSTALAALRFAEEQVFAPERGEFDALLNRKILPELGITLWRFKTSGNRTRDPDVVSTILERLVKVNVVTINEAREILADALGVSLPALDEMWARQPIELTLAGWLPEGEGESGDGDGDEKALQELVSEAQRRSTSQKPTSGGGAPPTPVKRTGKVEED
jgi:PBSX family phage portal protein